MKLIRPIIIGTALLLPGSTISCNKAKVKAPITAVKANDIVDKEFNILREKENSLRNKLNNWIHDIDSAFLYLTIGANNPAEEKLFEKMREETGLSYYYFLDSTSNLECMVGEPERIIEEKDDFDTNPNEKQVKLFIDAIKAYDKAGIFLEPYMKLSTDELIEKYGKNLDKLTPQTKQSARRLFDFYKKSLPNLAEEEKKFIQDIEKYNENAKVMKAPPYKSKWGLSLELLKSLKSIK